MPRRNLALQFELVLFSWSIYVNYSGREPQETHLFVSPLFMRVVERLLLRDSRRP